MAINVKRILADALIELSTEKPLRKITITELVERAGTGRQTFYNHFKDKNDLIYWIYSRTIAGERKLVETQGYADDIHVLGNSCADNRCFRLIAARVNDLHPSVTESVHHGQSSALMDVAASLCHQHTDDFTHCLSRLSLLLLTPQCGGHIVRGGNHIYRVISQSVAQTNHTTHLADGQANLSAINNGPGDVGTTLGVTIQSSDRLSHRSLIPGCPERLNLGDALLADLSEGTV